MRKARPALLLVLLLGTLLLTACGGGQGAPSGDRPPDGAAIEESTPAETTVSREEVGERVAAPGGSYVRVSPGELRAMLQDKDFVFVNTHVPFEGNIPRTDLSIPYNEIGDSLDRLPEDKGAKIVLYCRTGRMSAEAARTLVELGYSNVWDLDGGMVAWEQAGLRLEGV